MDFNSPRTPPSSYLLLLLQAVIEASPDFFAVDGGGGVEEKLRKLQRVKIILRVSEYRYQVCRILESKVALILRVFKYR